MENNTPTLNEMRKKTFLLKWFLTVLIYAIGFYAGVRLIIIILVSIVFIIGLFLLDKPLFKFCIWFSKNILKQEEVKE